MRKLLVAIFVLSTTTLFAQDNIYTLDHCITLSIQNAPELKASNAVIKQVLAIQKKIGTSAVLENLAVGAGGKIDFRRHLEFDEQYFLDNETQIPIWFGWQYGLGATLQYTLPFSASRHKKYDKKLAAAQVEEQRAVHLQQINLIKIEVINLYNRYEQASQDLTTTLESYNSQNIYYETSKLQYQTGELTETMFGPIELAYNGAKLTVSAARTNLKTAYQLLIVRVGEKITSTE